MLALALLTLPVGSPAMRHGVVFDAGSSGTRIHVYTWRTGGGGPKDQFDLVEDDILKSKPGLSAFKDRTAEAGSSLAPLIAHAKGKIPAELISSTPVFLMATAGLRMVGEEAKDAILRSVCAELSSSGFLFRCEWATLLDGRDEGLYGWVTVNYLLDTLYGSSSSRGRQPVGTIDLGGGSVQIVFPADHGRGAPEGLSQSLDFAGRKHSIYVKSHLGYGLDAARTAVLDLLVSRPQSTARPIRHPCLPQGAVLTHKGSELVGDGDWGRCLKLQQRLFDRSAACAYPSCAWGGTYQPPLPASFFGFSYLYDRVAAIGLIDGHPAQYGSQSTSRAEISVGGASLCSLDATAVASRYTTHPDGSKSANFCGDVAYIAALLGAFGFSDDAKLTMTNKIQVRATRQRGPMLCRRSQRRT